MVLQDDLRKRNGVGGAVRRDGADLDVVGSRHGSSTSWRLRERAELRCPPAAVLRFGDSRDGAYLNCSDWGCRRQFGWRVRTCFSKVSFALPALACQNHTDVILAREGGQ